jgi:hypothetical protein
MRRLAARWSCPARPSRNGAFRSSWMRSADFITSSTPQPPRQAITASNSSRMARSLQKRQRLRTAKKKRSRRRPRKARTQQKRRTPRKEKTRRRRMARRQPRTPPRTPQLAANSLSKRKPTACRPSRWCSTRPSRRRSTASSMSISSPAISPAASSRTARSPGAPCNSPIPGRRPAATVSCSRRMRAFPVRATSNRRRCCSAKAAPMPAARRG